MAIVIMGRGCFLVKIVKNGCCWYGVDNIKSAIKRSVEIDMANPVSLLEEAEGLLDKKATPEAVIVLNRIGEAP